MVVELINREFDSTAGAGFPAGFLCDLAGPVAFPAIKARVRDRLPVQYPQAKKASTPAFGAGDFVF